LPIYPLERPIPDKCCFQLKIGRGEVSRIELASVLLPEELDQIAGVKTERFDEGVLLKTR
jgi:hypothetical protein